MTQRWLTAQSASTAQRAKHTCKGALPRPRHSSVSEQSAAPSQKWVPPEGFMTFGAPPAVTPPSTAPPLAASPAAPALAAVSAPPFAEVPASAASPPPASDTEPPASRSERVPAASAAPAAAPPGSMLGAVWAPPLELGDVPLGPALAPLVVALPPHATTASATHAANHCRWAMIFMRRSSNATASAGSL